MPKLNRSIQRGLAVLEVIHSSGASSLAFLAERTGLSKPTLVRICATLEEQRWLTRRRSDGAYRLGSAFPHSSGQPQFSDRLVELGKDIIVQLSEKTGLAVDLAASTLDGRVEIVDTTRNYKLHGVFPDSVGFKPSPVLSALGLAFLAAQGTATESRDLIASLQSGLSKEERLHYEKLPQTIQSVRAQGFACRAPRHWGRAVDYGALPAALGVAVYDLDQCIGAVNLVWKADDCPVATVVANHLSALQAAADAIGAAFTDAKLGV